MDHARALQAIQDGHTSPAQLAIATALYAYEEARSQLKGRTFRANRTRQMITNRGALEAAERMVLSRKPSQGYEVLEEAGLQELSFEAIIVRFPDEFSEHAIQATQARLDGRPLRASSPSDDDVDEEAPMSAVVFDAEARAFLDGFSDPVLWFRANWLPRYRTQTQAIAQDLAENRLDEPFDILWKRVHNDISNAGQGVVKYDTVDAMHDDFIQAGTRSTGDFRPILLKNFRPVFGDQESTNFRQVLGHESSVKRCWRAKLMRNRLLVAVVFFAKFLSRVFQQN